MAWLSDSSRWPDDPLFGRDVPYVRLDGDFVTASHFDRLYDPQGSETVCDDWTSTSGTAPIGNANSPTSWTRGGLPPCDQSFHSTASSRAVCSMEGAVAAVDLGRNGDCKHAMK